MIKTASVLVLVWMALVIGGSHSEPNCIRDRDCTHGQRCVQGECVK